MVCLIPKVNSGVGEMRFMIGNLRISLRKPFTGDMNSTNLHYLTSVKPVMTSAVVRS